MEKHLLEEQILWEKGNVSINIKVRLNSTRYLDEFIGLKCATHLIDLKVYPNAKEITESMGCFRATIKALGGMEVCGRRDITYAVVGDGATPRTAAAFALRTRGFTVSIDPNMNEKWVGTDPCGVSRLTVYKHRIEQHSFDKYPHDLVIVMPHSHAPSNETLARLHCTGRRHLIWLPCCTKPNVPERPDPDIKYDDMGIWSPKRTVMIWKDI